MSFSSVYLSTISYLFEWFILQALKKGTCFFCYCSSIFIKNLTVASGRSASTGNLQPASPKSWWFRRHCRWRIVFHRDSTPQKGPWNCKKSGHESTETERETLREQELGKKIEKKKVLIWVPGLSAWSDRTHELEWFIFQYVQEN